MLRVLILKKSNMMASRLKYKIDTMPTHDDWLVEEEEMWMRKRMPDLWHWVHKNK